LTTAPGVSAQGIAPATAANGYRGIERKKLMNNMPALAESQSPSVQSHDESAKKPRNDFLFAMIPDDVMALKRVNKTKISPGAKLVFGVIFSLKQASAGRCFASNERIAQKTALTVQQVKRLLPVLEKAELIKRVAKNGAKCTRDSIEVLWMPGKELGEKCTHRLGEKSSQQLGDKSAQQLGENCIPKKTVEESLQKTSVGGGESEGELSVGGLVDATHDDQSERNLRKRQIEIPEDVLGEVRDLLGDALAGRIANAARTLHDIVGNRWDALVDTAKIVRDELALSDDDDGVRNPMRYFVGTVKNVIVDLLEDDRLDADGFMSIPHFGRVTQETVNGIHDGESPAKIRARLMDELNEYGDAGSLLVRQTNAIIDEALGVIWDYKTRDLSSRYLDPDGKLNRWVKWNLEEAIPEGIALGMTGKEILRISAEKTNDAEPSARHAIDAFVRYELSWRLPDASIRLDSGVPEQPAAMIAEEADTSDSGSIPFLPSIGAPA
jgi:Helix-turn-helix domain